MKFVNLDEFAYNDLCLLDSVSVDGIYHDIKKNNSDIIKPTVTTTINTSCQNPYFIVNNLFSELQTYELKKKALENLQVFDAIENSIQEIREPIINWSESFDLNDIIDSGVYTITGIRESNERDHLPINNFGNNASISAKLFITESPEGNTTYRSIIGQTLFLSNAEGHETKIYTRSANKTSYDGGISYEITWGDWQVCQGMKEVGIIDSYDSFIDNGVYSGVYKTDSTIETFVIVTINDYAVKSQSGAPKSVSQFKYSIDAKTSKIKLETRVAINDSLEWGEWSNINDVVDNLTSTETNKALSARQGKKLNDNKLDKLERYVEDLSNCTVEIFERGKVSISIDNHENIAKVSTYYEDEENGITPVARIESTYENGDYAYVETRGAKVNIYGDRVTVNDVDLVHTIQDVATLKGTGDGSVTKTVSDEIAKIVNSAPAMFDTLKEIADYITEDISGAEEIFTSLGALNLRVYELGDFPTSGDAERKAAEETISKSPSISIIHYTVNGVASHIILQDVNDDFTQQVLYYGGHTYIRHLGPNLDTSWKKTNPTNIKYNQDSHRIALMHMVNRYGEGDNNIDWVELPTATTTKDGLMTMTQVKSLEGKQDKLQTYKEDTDKAEVKMPNGNSYIRITTDLAGMYAQDGKSGIVNSSSGSRLVYMETATDSSGDSYTSHRDDISIGKHDDDSTTHITLTSKSTTENTGETGEIVKTTNTSTIQVNPEGVSMSSPEGEIGDVVKTIADLLHRVETLEHKITQLISLTNNEQL